MARGLNKVMLIGHLGNDPEIRHTTSNSMIATINVATTESWKDKETGEKQERTEWHRVVFFGRLAEIVGEYLRKGAQAYVEGAIRTRKWTDKEGIERYSTEIVASEMQMLGARQQDGQGSERGATTRETRTQNHNSGKGAAPPAETEVDGDMPF